MKAVGAVVGCCCIILEASSSLCITGSNICHPLADRHVPTDQSKFNKIHTYSLVFYLFLRGLRVLLGGLMTIGELWDPDLVGHGVLESSEALEALEKAA